MKQRFYAACIGFALGLEQWAKRKEADRAYRQRCDDGAHWVGVVLLCVTFAAPACVPRHVERSIASELRRCEAAINAAPASEAEEIGRQCHARIERIDP
jgi:hypothetical protein